MLENVCTAIPQMDTIYLRKNAANKNITGTLTVNSAKKWLLPRMSVIVPKLMIVISVPDVIMYQIFIKL